MKIIPNQDFDKKEVNKEIEILKNLKHPNVIEYVEFFEDGFVADILIMEYCSVN